MKDRLKTALEWVSEYAFEILISITILSIAVFIFTVSIKTIEENKSLTKEALECKELLVDTRVQLLETEELNEQLSDRIAKFGNELKCEKKAESNYLRFYNETCEVNWLGKNCALPFNVASKLYSQYQKERLICVEKYD